MSVAGHAWRRSIVCQGCVGSHATSAPEAVSLIPSAWADKAGSLSDLWRHLLRRNVYESLEQYTKVEPLAGENQYMAEGFGMQVRLTPAWCAVCSLHVACSLSMGHRVQLAMFVWQGSAM